MRAILLFVLVGATTMATAQFRSVNRLALETNVGFSVFHGDIVPSAINVSMQVGGTYSFLRSMGIGASLNYSGVSSRVDQYNRAFSGNIVGVQVDYHINIPQLLTDYPQSFPVSPYVRFGAGYDISQITTVDYGSANIAAKNAYPENVVLNQSWRAVTVPTVIGAYFRLNSYADINLKLNYVYANSDMMDGHQQSFIGNKYNDSYSMIMVGVRFKSFDRRAPHITGR